MKNIFRLLTDTSVYREIPKWSYSHVILVLFLGYLIAATLKTSAYFVQTYAKLQQFGQQNWQQLTARWPESLVFSYSQGTLTASPSAEIKLPYPEGIPTEGLPSTFLTFSPTDTRPTETESIIIATQKEIGVFETPGNYQWSAYQELAPNESAIFDREKLQSTTPAVEAAWNTTLKILGAGLFFLTLLVLPLGRVLTALLFSIFLPSVFHAFGNTRKWSAIWKIILVTLPIAEIAQGILSFATHQNPLRIFWIIWLGIILVINITNQKKIKA